MNSKQGTEISAEANARRKRSCGSTVPIQPMGNSSTGRKRLFNGMIKEAVPTLGSPVFLQIRNQFVALALPMEVIQRKESIKLNKTASATSFLKVEKKSESENLSPNATASGVPSLGSRKRSYGDSFITQQNDVGKYRDNICSSPKLIRRLGVEKDTDAPSLELDKRNEGNNFIQNKEMSQHTCVGQEDALLAFSILGNFDSMLKIETAS